MEKKRDRKRDHLTVLFLFVVFLRFLLSQQLSFDLCERENEAEKRAKKTEKQTHPWPF